MPAHLKLHIKTWWAEATSRNHKTMYAFLSKADGF